MKQHKRRLLAYEYLDICAVCGATKNSALGMSNRWELVGKPQPYCPGVKEAVSAKAGND